MQKRFFCQGGVHYDYLWSIQDKIHLGHSHPASQDKEVGGVAFNVALAMGMLGEYVHLQSAGGEDSADFLEKIQEYGIDSFHRDDSVSKETPEYHGVFSQDSEFLFGLSKSQAYRKLPTRIINKITEYDHHVIDSNVPADFFLEAVKKKAYARSLILVSAIDAEKCHAYLPHLDNIFMNGDEAQLFLEDSQTPPLGLAKKLVEMGVKEVFITLGALGVVVANAYGTEYVTGNRVERAAHVNGAGDTFAGLVLAFKGKGFTGFEAATKAQALMPHYLQEGRAGLRAHIDGLTSSQAKLPLKDMHHVAV